MYSSSSFIQSIALLLTTFSQLTSSTPVPEAAVALAANCPVLPASSLPKPTLKFQYAVIGRGIQNYTCAAVGEATAQLGAVATLYDATSIARTSVAMLNTIPGLAVNGPPAANGVYPLPAQFRSLKVIGKHTFIADGTPFFDLTAVNKKLFAAKNDSAVAPANAPKGPLGTGAVPWLQLNAKPTYGSVGLGMVYRVVTAGGNPPTTCSTTGVVTVPYAAEYWFYA